MHTPWLLDVAALALHLAFPCYSGDAAYARYKSMRKRQMIRVPHKIRDALVDGIADGLRRYLPGCVGLVAMGIPVCLLAAFAHFVIGASVLTTTETAGAGTLVSALYGFARALRGQ